MSKTVAFLDTLSDRELAFFAKYKLHTYMTDTQYEIQRYIDGRKLYPNAIDKLLKEKVKVNQQYICCPRCGSDKLLKNNVRWTEIYSKYDLRKANQSSNGICKDEIICTVCDFWLEDPNKKAPKGNSKRKVTIWNFISAIFDNL